jgi:hypothetical protein
MKLGQGCAEDERRRIDVPTDFSFGLNAVALMSLWSFVARQSALLTSEGLSRTSGGLLALLNGKTSKTACSPRTGKTKLS